MQELSNVAEKGSVIEFDLLTHLSNDQAFLFSSFTKTYKNIYSIYLKKKRKILLKKRFIFKTLHERSILLHKLGTILISINRVFFFFKKSKNIYKNLTSVSREHLVVKKDFLKTLSKVSVHMQTKHLFTSLTTYFRFIPVCPCAT